jgi:hypothetical protein
MVAIGTSYRAKINAGGKIVSEGESNFELMF